MAQRGIIASMPFHRAWILLPLFGFWGCSSPSIKTPAKPNAATNATQKPISKPISARFMSPQDDLGRAVGLKTPAMRVVVIGPGAIETVFALGAQKSLIGRDDYADYPPAARKIAVAGNFSGPGVEKCIALHPDLVIVQGETWDKARVEGWQTQIGAPVAALTATNLAGVRRDFLKIGAWLNRSKAAQNLAKTLTESPPSSLPKPQAFFEVGRAPLYSTGRGTLVADVMRAAGFGNIAGDLQGYQPFGVESLIARAPDVYIATSKKPRAAIVRELRADATLSKLKCIQRGQIIVVDGDLLLRPGPRLRLGIKALISSRNARID